MGRVGALVAQVGQLVRDERVVGDVDAHGWKLSACIRPPSSVPTERMPRGWARRSSWPPRRRRPGTCRSARSSSARTASVIGEGRNVREERGDPTGHAEVVAPARGRAGAGLLAARRLHPRRDPGAVRHVRRCGDGAARVERVVFGAWDPKAGACGSVWDLTRDPRATPPRRGRRRGPRRRSRRPCWSISSRAAGSGKAFPAVACPSGLRSTPRKRVWG